MHTMQFLFTVTLAALLPLSAAADDHSHGGKQTSGEAQTQEEHQQSAGGESMMDRCRAMMGMQHKMAAEMKAADAELDQLLAEMNGSTGDKKIDAMSAVLNRLVQQRKAMHMRMADMQTKMMHHMMKVATDESSKTSSATSQPRTEGAKPSEHQH